MIANIRMTSIKLYNTNIVEGVSADIVHMSVGYAKKVDRMVAIVKNEQNEEIASVPIAWSVNRKAF